MEDINNCKILDFENQKYNLKVGFDDEENKYEKGIQKYLKYCKKNKITKDYIQKVYDMKYFTEDIMKFYKPKAKERL